jgi:hypothetical protein
MWVKIVVFLAKITAKIQSLKLLLSLSTTRLKSHATVLWEWDSLTRRIYFEKVVVSSVGALNYT